MMENDEKGKEGWKLKKREGRKWKVKKREGRKWKGKVGGREEGERIKNGLKEVR